MSHAPSSKLYGAESIKCLFNQYKLMRKKKEFREELKTFFPNEEIYSFSRPLILFLLFHYIWKELLVDTFLYVLISMDITTKFRSIVMLTNVEF